MPIAIGSTFAFCRSAVSRRARGRNRIARLARDATAHRRWFAPALPLRIARLLREWQTDVVHTHNDRPCSMRLRRRGWRRRGCVIHTKHGRAVRNTRRQMMLTALSARLTDHFVCVSDDCTACRRAGCARVALHTIDNGIDLSRFRCTGPNLRGPAVTVAQAVRDKDLGTLLDAVALVVRTAPEFRLWIAGDGPCRGELEQRIGQLGLTGCVRMLGAVSDVPTLLQQARMFALSSVSEGVPIAVLEAMASGLPVAATRVGGVPDAVDDTRTGLLVPPRHPSALANALCACNATTRKPSYSACAVVSVLRNDSM